MRLHKRDLHELPYREIVISGTIRLDPAVNRNREHARIIHQFMAIRFTTNPPHLHITVADIALCYVKFSQIEGNGRTIQS